MTRAETRRINDAIDALATGHVRRAMTALCALIRRTPVPEVVDHRTTSKDNTCIDECLDTCTVPCECVCHQRTLPTAAEAGRGQAAGTLTGSGSVRHGASAIPSQPKPRRRIVDRAVLAAYAAAHPACEVLGCTRPPCPEAHHLRSRKMHGDDVPSNLLRLCRPMHAEWHRGGAKSWLQIYSARLAAEARAKVERALRVSDTDSGGVSIRADRENRE